MANVAAKRVVGLVLVSVLSSFSLAGCSAPVGELDRAPDQSAIATPGKVLILSATVVGGTNSLEARLAGSGAVDAGDLGTLTGLGYTVDVVSNAQWAAMTTAQFASYQAIVLGDANCVGAAAASAAIASTDVWGPAITGNVVLLGTDPVFHFNFTRPNVAQVTYNALQFAASKPNATGAYISLSCYYVTAPAETPVPLLSPFGNFTVHQVGCFNDSHIVAVHPALNGLTDPILSNWGCSVHEVFDGFPSASFVPLAIARNAAGGGSLSFADGSVGIPYVLARGAIPVRCGDGVEQSPEECDHGAANGTCGDRCSSICKLHWCGDGAVDAGEQCDLGCGNGAPGGTCTADCRSLDANRAPIARCTDVTVTAGATCSAAASIDDGSSDPDEGDTISCVQAPSDPYGAGTTSVTLTCTDSHGASASCTGNVTVVDLTAPTIACPGDQIVACSGGGGGTATFTATSADNCSVASQSCSPPSGSVFPIGTTLDTCTATDGAGNAATCTFTVTVSDAAPPIVTTGPPTVLWPPNHHYRTFDLSDCVTQVSDHCEGALDIATAGRITRVTSDEREDDKLACGGDGDGDTCRDIVITGNTSVDLRAERSGGGNGRVYTVFFDVSDASGNTSSSSCTVIVPHDRPHDVAVDDGCRYCEGAGCGTCPGHDAACR